MSRELREERAATEDDTATINVSQEAVLDALAEAVNRANEAPENAPIVIALIVTGLTPDTKRVINNSKAFGDVTSVDWFYSAILFVSSRELFMGVSETRFAPNSNMTRAMLARFCTDLKTTKMLVQARCSGTYSPSNGTRQASLERQRQVLSQAMVMARLARITT